MITTPAIELNDGRTIPQLGFGAFQVDPADTAWAVTAALEIGYRHEEVREYGEAHGIARQAWSPIAQGAVLSDLPEPRLSDVIGAAGRPAAACSRSARRRRRPGPARSAGRT